MARDFDGATGSYLGSIGTGLAIQYPFSMCCWFNCDLATGELVIMSIELLGNLSHRTWLVARGDVGGDPIQFCRDEKKDDRQNTQTSTGYTVGQWHLASCNYAAVDDADVYIDGGSKGSSSVSRDVDARNDVIVGRRVGTGDEFNGRLAEAAIWHGGVLTDEEHALLAHGYSPLFVRRDLLVFYAPIIGRSDPEPEFMGANGLVVNGSAVYADHPRITRPAS